MFLFRCVLHSLSLPLSSCLGCIPLLIGLPFLCSRLRRMFVLPYAYYVVVFCLFLLFLLLLFVFVFVFFFYMLVSSVYLLGDDVFC